MSLEALVGGKICISIWLPRLSPDFTSNNYSLLLDVLTGTTSWRLPETA
jgi:hypothetical protein